MTSKHLPLIFNHESNESNEGFNYEFANDKSER